MCQLCESLYAFLSLCVCVRFLCVSLPLLCVCVQVAEVCLPRGVTCVRFSPDGNTLACGLVKTEEKVQLKTHNPAVAPKTHSTARKKVMGTYVRAVLCACVYV